MTRYALTTFPLFTTVAATFDYYIPPTATHKAYSLENETNLLSSYPGVKGIKTGYTPEAGLCLVTYLDYAGHKIIAVLLHSDDRRSEMKELLDYSLKDLGVTPPKHN
jgi:D-alanyl-D-alanine carboxypeptidase (penicillin-binding protein 5/6)